MGLIALSMTLRENISLNIYDIDDKVFRTDILKKKFAKIPDFYSKKIRKLIFKMLRTK